MGENGVYRKQFYTKLVRSCHFMSLYLNICSFFFCYERHMRCIKVMHVHACIELLAAVGWVGLIPPSPLLPPPQHVVSLPLSEMCLRRKMIKDPVEPPSHCGSSPRSEEDLIWGEQTSDEPTELPNGHKIKRYPLMSILHAGRSQTGIVWSHVHAFLSFQMPDWSPNRCSTHGMHPFPYSLPLITHLIKNLTFDLFAISVPQNESWQKPPVTVFNKFGEGKQLCPTFILKSTRSGIEVLIEVQCPSRCICLSSPASLVFAEINQLYLVKMEFML